MKDMSGILVLTCVLGDAMSLGEIYGLMFDKLRSISVGTDFLLEIEARRRSGFDASKQRGDNYLFELMVRCIHSAGFKASILKGKWNAIGRAFSNYHVGTVAAYTEQDIASILSNREVLRHGGKDKGMRREC